MLLNNSNSIFCINVFITEFVFMMKNIINIKKLSHALGFGLSGFLRYYSNTKIQAEIILVISLRNKELLQETLILYSV